MRELYRIAIFSIVSIVIFIAVGLALYNNRPAPSANVEAFFGALENPKVGRYFLNLAPLNGKNVLIEVQSAGVATDACYILNASLFQRSESCEPNIKITMDEHAIGSLLAADYYPKSTLISEFIFGHIRLEGLTLKDIMVLL